MYQSRTAGTAAIRKTTAFLLVLPEILCICNSPPPRNGMWHMILAKLLHAQLSPVVTITFFTDYMQCNSLLKAGENIKNKMLNYWWALIFLAGKA